MAEPEYGAGEDMAARLHALETQYAETRRSAGRCLAATGRAGKRSRRHVRRE